MTRKQIQELLEKLNADLKAEIEASQSSLKDARSITTKITNLLGKATDLLSKLEDPESGVDAKLAESTDNAQIITNSVAVAADSLKTIKGHLLEVEEQIAAMETTYTDFLATKAKIDDPSTGLEALLTAARQYKAQVQASATQVSSLETKIEQTLAAIQQNVATMQTAYTDFQAIKDKIDDTETGFDALLDSSQSLKDDLVAINKDSQTIYKEISRYKDQAAKNAAGIQTIKEESDTALEQIRQNETESEETRTRISEIFELVSQSGHANYFDERRKKLIYASWAWLTVAVVSIIAAVIMADKFLLPLLNATTEIVNGKEVLVKPKDIELGALILRALMITPIVAFAIFAFRNYGKERRLAEQYAFKAVSASTIEGSIALIERSLKTVPSEHLNTQLADFAIKTAHSLHAEPQELQKVSRWKFNAGNKLVNVGAEINDTLEDISKDLKQAVSSSKKDEK